MLANSHRYTSTATREADMWLTRCDQHPEAQSWTRLLDQATREQQRAIAALVGAGADEITVSVKPILSDAVQEQITLARDLRATATQANHDAAVAHQTAAKLLANAQLSLRDIGTILGVSFQRAHQLISARPGSMEADTPFNPEPAQPEGYQYQRFADYIASRIESGVYPPGTQLRGERDLSLEHGVSTGTVRRAIQLLQERGLVIVLPARGTFVTKRDREDSDMNHGRGNES